MFYRYLSTTCVWNMDVHVYLLHIHCHKITRLNCHYWLYPFSDVTDDILGFFLALFQGLRLQMGPAFTETTIRTFMSMFTRYVCVYTKVFVVLLSTADELCISNIAK